MKRDDGSIAIAVDHTANVKQRAEFDRYVEANARMLDQLATGVAIFDRGKRLVSHNAAYRRIWGLEPAFLETQPQDGEILDLLRARRSLPEQADYKNWKALALGGYRALEPIEQTWHLPDGRTLRVVASPNSQGGVTYLYDDATQSYTLASQVHTLTHVQGETLEALKEGVAVFGADGRMKLVNKTFCALWSFDPQWAGQRPHIEEIARLGAPLEFGSQIWLRMRDQIVGLPESASSLHRKNRALRTASSWNAARSRCRTARPCLPSLIPPPARMLSVRCLNATMRSSAPSESAMISSTTFRTNCALL